MERRKAMQNLLLSLMIYSADPNKPTGDQEVDTFLNSLKNFFEKYVLGIAMWAVGIIGVIICIRLFLKMYFAKSAEDKQAVKASFIWVLIGTVGIVLASTAWTIVVSVANTLV